MSSRAYILAEIQQGRDAALAIHDAADAQGVAHALVHAVFEGDFNIRFEALQAADAHAVHDIPGALEGLPTVGGGLDLRFDAVGLQIPLAELRHHLQVLFADVRERHFEPPQLRHMHDVGKQRAGEGQAARANDSQFKSHGYLLLF